MRFIRRFEKKDWAHNFSVKSPKLSLLFECFGINYRGNTVDPVSVFAANTEIHELEAVAALVQTTSGTPEIQHGVVISESDCLAAGIAIDSSEPGGSGIVAVDARHANLIGTKEQFARLFAQIVRRIWEGEHRVRTFPVHQVVGQIAVFTCLPDDEIHSVSRDDCRKILGKVPQVSRIDDPTRFEIVGKLDDKLYDCPVVATRNVNVNKKSQASTPSGWFLLQFLRLLLFGRR